MTAFDPKQTLFKGEDTVPRSTSIRTRELQDLRQRPAWVLVLRRPSR